MASRPRSNNGFIPRPRRPSQEHKVVEITIRVDDNGNVNVSGPISNKLMCYGMLELARDAIKNFAEKQAASPIVPVNGPLLVPRKAN